MSALFTLTIGLGALLLFSLQPMFAKLALPLLGGAPAVWSTALVFFQATLLAGYVYAHLSLRWLGPRRQSLCYLGLLLLALTALPVALAEGWTPPAAATPVAWLLALLAVSIGLPFFALAATAPMLQAWFWASGRAASGGPYRLYAASNLGSILALVGYPLLAEPLFGLATQGRLWSVGYGVFLLLMAAVAVALWRGTGQPTPRRPEAAAAPGLSRRLHWLALSFVPAGLLVGVTLHVTTNLVALPLFWVVPLVLYLLSFVLVFARRTLLPHAWMVRAQPFLLIVLALELPFPVQETMPVVALHLATFFVTAMVCHGELARRRPEPEQLTEFYLWLALGGVLGGIAAAIVAPLVFDAVVEYPLLLVLACLLRPGVWRAGRWRLAADSAVDLALPALIVLPPIAIAVSPPVSLFALGWVAVYLYAVAAGALCYSFHERPPRFALGLGALLVAGAFAGGLGDDILVAERSFFGVSQVQETENGFRLLWHGATIYGAQELGPGRPEPKTYYARRGPVGQVFGALRAETAALAVGVVGLGPGAAACYRRQGDSWRFYEIDPAVVAIARDRRYFTYLSACAPEVGIVLGDARLTLATAPDGGFDLLLLDAFTSDVVPLHLLTREAFQLYLAKLAPDGLILVNISNGHFALEPVLAALGREAGLEMLSQRYRPRAPAAAKRFEFGSDWVLLARDEARLTAFASSGRWRPLVAEAGLRAWTDDWADVLGVIRW